MFARKSVSNVFRRPKQRFRSRSLFLETLENRSLMAAAPFSVDSAGLRSGSQGTDSGLARIINGNPTTGFPSVGMVGDTSGNFCTGTLIAPQYVLTAAHCAEGVSNANGRFTLGANTFRTSQVFVHPNYNGNRIGDDEANDIAIYKLATAVTNVTPSPIFRGTPLVGQILTLVGFGGGGTGSSGTDGTFGTKRVGTTPIDAVTPKMIRWNFDNNSEANTAPGDSGGPAFLTIGGVNYVAGVTSGGEQANAGLGDTSFDTRVDAFAAWIDSIVGTVNPPTTVVSVQSTDAAAAETLSTQAANTGTYVVTRSGSLTAALSVNLAWSGTATNGTDYNQIATTVTIPAGSASASITLTPRDDTTVEGTETAILTIVGSSLYSIDSARGTATVSLADNDQAPVRNNDLFANRIVLSGTSATVTGDNTNATRESREPNILGVSGGKSVWWTWTAPVSGTVVMTTAGSGFDTTLGVYQGTAVRSLREVAVNDDDATSGALTSRVSFQAVAGSSYQIMVDGYDGARGNIRFNLQQTANRVSRSAERGVPELKPVVGSNNTNFGAMAYQVSPTNPSNRHIRRTDQVFAKGISDLLCEFA